MSQQNAIRTLIFVALAAASVALAAFIRPTSIEEPPARVGQTLFPHFNDITAVNALEVVYHDDAKNRPATLSVAINDEGNYVLPSHNNYPADADGTEANLQQAALKLMDLEILGVATELPAEHQYYGVLEPNPDDPNQSDTGLGRLVLIKNAEGKDLAKLIIGKPVKRTGEAEPEQYFVRVPAQSHVFAVKIDPEDFPTQLGEWIDGDLLDLNTSDIKQVVFRDYTFSKQRIATPFGIGETANEVYSPRHTITVNWDQSDWKWSLASYIEYRNGSPYPTQLLEEEELNASKLSDMKSGLNQLKIVDVETKPPGLSADLRVDDALITNKELGSLLQEKGFYPRRVPDNAGGYNREMLSSDGEVRIGTKEGVEYILRFGKPAGITVEDGETKLNRYLLVSASFNPDLIPLPELEEVPDPPADEPPAASESNGESADEGQSDTEATGASPDNEPEESEYEKEKKRIEADNKNKQVEYEKTVERGQSRVNELNARFANWYYVISEDVYKKIQLGRFDIVQEKSDAEGYGIDDFRELQEAGLEKNTEEEDHDHDHE